LTRQLPDASSCAINSSLANSSLAASPGVTHRMSVTPHGHIRRPDLVDNDSQAFVEGPRAAEGR
jgi:hypothetical protein